MFEKIIKKLKFLNKKNHTNAVNYSREVSNESFSKPKCNITISNEEGYHKVILSDYASIKEFNGNELLDLISWNISWDSSKQMFYNGSYYIITDNNIIYNILINDKMIKIDERIQFENYSHEKIITIDFKQNKLSFFKCKHTLSGSSYDTMFYHEDDDFSLKELELTKEETKNEINSIFDNLNKYNFIESIININELFQFINEKLNKKIELILK